MDNNLKNFVIGSSAPVFLHWYLSQLKKNIYPGISYSNFVLIIPFVLGLLNVAIDYSIILTLIPVIFLIFKSKLPVYVIVNLIISYTISLVIDRYYDKNEYFKSFIIGSSGLVVFFTMFRVINLIKQNRGVKVNYDFNKFTFFEPIVLGIINIILRFALNQGITNPYLIYSTFGSLLWFMFVVYLTNSYSYNNMQDSIYHLIESTIFNLPKWIILVPYLENLN